MRERLPLWVIPALAFALLVNGLLFLLLATLMQKNPSLSEMTDPTPVHLVRVREQEPPPPEEEPPPPEKEEPEEIPEFVTPDLRPHMKPVEMDPLPFRVELNPKIMSGPPIAVGRFYELGELDQPPRPLVKMSPLYPFKAKRMETEGYVKVKFLVDDEGRVSRVSVLEASPKGVFDASVLQTLPSWKFSPGMILGEPVSSWVVTTIRFELK